MAMIKKIKEMVNDLFSKAPEEITEEIRFSKLEDWIDEQEENIRSMEEEMSRYLQKELSGFIDGIKEKVELLKPIDLEGVRESNRTKHIVMQNLKEYIKLVENLIEGLEDIRSKDFKKLNKEVSDLFNEFNLKSYQKYQKATYLIGKELGKTHKSIQQFLKTYSDFLDENKRTIRKGKAINDAKKDLEELRENELDKKRLNSNIKDIKKKVNDSKEEIDKKLAEVEDIRKSEKYLEIKKNLDVEKDLDAKIKKDIVGLKQVIDLKSLTKIFHVSERYREVVKGFKNSFEESFKNDNGKKLVKLLDEARLNNDMISKKIEQINKDIKELERLRSLPKEDLTKQVEDKIEALKKNIEDLEDQSSKEQKRLQKVDERIDQIKDSVKKELLKIDLVVK